MALGVSMADGTAWARVGLPQTTPIKGLADVIADGQQSEIRKQTIGMNEFALKQAQRSEDDEMKLRSLGQEYWDASKRGDKSSMSRLINEIAAIDPEEATKVHALVGTVDRTQLVTAFHHILAADAMGDDVNAQNVMLAKALDIVGPGNVYYDGISQIMNMPPGLDREKAILQSIEMGINMGLSPTMAKSKIEAAKIAATKGTDKEKFQYQKAKDIRSTLNTNLKSFRLVEESSARINAIKDRAIKGSPAAQLGLIFNFMKSMDPGSVVRESEFRTAADARAFLEKVDNGKIKVNAEAAPGVAAIRRILTGQKMTEKQVYDFVDSANTFVEGSREQADNIIMQQLQVADQEGIPRSRILGADRMSELSDRINKRKEKKISDDAKTGKIPTITDKSGFDALPSGAIYINNGKKYRKP
jgi:hypothetical protein